MDEDDEIASLLAQLKRAYRSAGISYSDIASTLGASQPTVKRWMLGRGLSLTVLARLCGIAGLTIAELVGAAREGAAKELPLMTDKQARFVSGDVVLGMTFFLLSRQWSVERIRTELVLDQAAVEGALARLDRIGVIALFPGNRTRLLRRMSGDVRQHSAMFELVARRVHEFFDAPNLGDPEVAWTNGLARLSASSFAKVSNKLNQLRDELFALGEADLDLPPEQVRWYMLFAAARPVPVQQLLYGDATRGKGEVS